MIHHQLVYDALLIGTCGYALWRGQSEERIVALACAAATAATLFVIPPVNVRYRGVETGLLVIDLLVLAVFIFVALRSFRFWPLWVAGIQLTSSTAHLMKAMDEHLLPAAYATAVALWSYPTLIILAVATFRARQTSRASVVPNTA